MNTTFAMIGTVIARMTIGAILVIAGTAKIRNGRTRFLQSILGYDLVPDRMAVLIARGLPFLEVMTGLMLLIGFITQVAAMLAFGSFLLFTLAITHSLIQGRSNDCGCFRHITPVQWRLVYRNMFLMALLLPIYTLKGGAFSVDVLITSNINLPISLLSSGMILLLFLWGSIFIAVLLVKVTSRKQIDRSTHS